MSNVNTAKAYAFIRERILDGRYEAGARLQTIKLADEIGMSRTPVREALRQLEAEGLVEIRAHAGANVRVFSFSEFREMCELRLALESAAAELAARHHNLPELLDIQAEFEEMERVDAALEQDPTSADLIEQSRAHDIAFHFAILRAAHNNLIRSEILRLHVLNRVMGRAHENPTPLDPAKHAERRRWILECHRRIFLAIKNHDPGAARAAMDEHIRDMVDRSILALALAEKKAAPHEMVPEAIHAPYV